MKITKVKQLQAPFVKDKDGDWWIAAQYMIGKPEDSIFYICCTRTRVIKKHWQRTEDGGGATIQYIKSTYRVIDTSWDMKRVKQEVLKYRGF